MENTIRELIARGELEAAINSMLESTKYTSIYSSIIILSGRYNAIKQKERNGEISFPEKSIEENKIRASLIELIEHNRGDRSIYRKLNITKSAFNRIFIGIYLSAVVGIISTIFIKHDLINKKNIEINKEIESTIALNVRNGKIEDAYEQFQNLSQNYPNNDSLQFLTAITKLYVDTTKSIEDKFSKLYKLSSIHPSNPTLNFLLGNLCHATGRDDDAIRYYNTTLMEDTSFAVAHLNRGVSLQKLGEFSESLKALETANRLTKDWNTSALSNIINLYYVFDRHEDVLSYANKAISVEDFFEPVFFMALSKRIQAEHDFSIMIMDNLLEKLENPVFIENEKKHIYFYNVNNNGLTPVIIYIMTIEDKKALLLANKTLTFFLKKDFAKMKENFAKFKNSNISASKKEEIATFLYLYEVQNLVRNKILTLEQEKSYLQIIRTELNI